ncbi:excinuclease ABC subunit UvrB [Flammeovirga yaeyamensis]|uniref:UvrABC system protein B n=1 Tax=Flammeovirga yaeyamensis TaxID=367791 RepID=A0AAX1N5B7_9BACT|nr:excinuclease ABC subunit UvrB [Flammeovirga yaeyamensis]MBB3701546.1 excinuclease ABC subunit B [Flammeovirga yaeyamensis]NMF38690.1 excinuclease ABC subunit UvrB [Flammeovirga yaeyamensis]QWG01556.1 excinuclease ABC subunit UvrB [Flammeovirga yaeyamensis]
MDFKLIADFKPMGDQPAAIKQLAEGVESGEESQILLGVTGSGKTFSIANVIKETGRPTLILSHNKTLAAQLYGEFKQFFPENAVEYFISYYDYYQPEAYIQTTDTFIEKDLMINEEIEKLRLACTSALLSGRRDVIVIASVSCIYGIGNPEEFGKNVLKLRTGIEYPRQKLLRDFVDILYSRNEMEFNRGNFRVKGDTVDIYPAYADFAYRIIYWDDEIEEIQRIDPITGKMQSREDGITIFPANLFVTSKDTVNDSIVQIQDEMIEQIRYFEKDQRVLESKRIKERTEFDLEMIRELGYCSGIENYSRFFDRRRPGQRPFCLLDYFPDDFLMVIDESHVTLPQIRAMWGGDRSRKISLVDNGFRLPSALDNRPLTFNEFESIVSQSIYVSATPGDYELLKTEGAITEQVIRPTGLLDPEIDVRPTLNQIDDLLEEVTATIEKGDRILITTLTKRMAEELSRYLDDIGVKSTYLHSEIKPLDRVEILRQLRLGIVDVLVGVNLLREGLDLPEVSLVAIMDADKEGFLRNERSLIQTIGRAARNSEGRVIMYADKMTKSMEKAISETKRRRKLQHEYNVEHGITPTTVRKSHDAILEQTQVADRKTITKEYQTEEESQAKAAEEASTYQENSKSANIKEQLAQVKKDMEKAASNLDFVEAARLRDIMFELERVKNSKV